MATRSVPFIHTSKTASPASDRLTIGIVALAGIASAAVIGGAFHGVPVAALFIALFAATAAIAYFATRRGVDGVAEKGEADIALVEAAIGASGDAVVVTRRDGRLIASNRAYEELFPDLPTPDALDLADSDPDRLVQAMQAAWRDGAARVEGLRHARALLDVEIRRVGGLEEHLVWRFARAATLDLVAEAYRLIEGEAGMRLGLAGVMALIVDAQGRVLAANPAFQRRATGRPDGGRGQDLSALLATGADDRIRIAAEPPGADPLRLIQVPLNDKAEDSATLFFLLDDDGLPALDTDRRGTLMAHVQGLLATLPLGLALAERDGRFVFMNQAFIRAAGIESETALVYPTDLVVDEDKATVSDAVRRFASGRSVSGDTNVRLKRRPEEIVSLTIAGARGLGDAAVLLSIKDNSEESKLKRQVAQATKMQAVGQLAGGVAHDFNNILTAIIGHCDLMMMRHTPGDSDYDDIQQIKHNSNRAASLTRQLLAFSRQQTLRPQILQLPDVISEISNLLKRLLGETVSLVVKHGRTLGAVRADPGQLEQVIVNLAVNARDAMPEGGTLTLQTYSVTAADVRRLGSDILPVADYTALSVTDTGTGIPPDVLGKIFEPFFTTKEVGKGTGLGLSTVYGIVKQTGGFIFADSKMGEGSSFVIYLPVHHAEQPLVAPTPARRERPDDTWGTGTILLVEDEPMVRAVAERALGRQGYRVLTAENGEEALEVLFRSEEKGEAINLLISDVVMPTMDGPTMVRHARERFPDLPILFMSGYAEEQLRQSIDLDHVAFLPKPFSVQQLGAAARDALIGAK